MQQYSKITFFIFAVFDVRRSVAVNMCSFFTLIFAVFLLMSSPISCRSISTVNQTLIISWWICNFKPCCSKSKTNCYITHKFWKWKFAHLWEGGVTRRFVIWYSLQHFQQMFVTFSAIFATWLAQWLYTVRQAWKQRWNEVPGQEASTMYPIPIVIFATDL